MDSNRHETDEIFTRMLNLIRNRNRESLNKMHAVLTGLSNYIETNSEDSSSNRRTRRSQSLLRSKGLSNILLTKGGFTIPNIEIRDSSIGGKGLFAVEDIKAGSFITFYPGDMCYLKASEGEEDMMSLSNELTNFLEKDNNVPRTSEELFKLFDRYIEYKHFVSDNDYIIGHPELIEDPKYLGHMIRDAAANSSSTARENYNQAMPHINALSVILGTSSVSTMCFLASRDIKVNEEILMIRVYDGS